VEQIVANLDSPNDEKYIKQKLDPIKKGLEQ
jgi:hypothetical protein